MAFKAGVGDITGIGPESPIPGCLESVSESNRAIPWYWNRNRYRNSGFQSRIGIDAGIGYQGMQCEFVFTMATYLWGQIQPPKVMIVEKKGISEIVVA